MEQKLPDESVQEDLSAVGIVRELYRWKWVVGGIALLAGIAAAGWSLTLPNEYEAAAALTVREPEPPVTGETAALSERAPTLSVETVRTLAQSTKVVWTVFNELWSEKALEQWQQGSPDMIEEFPEFEEMLMTQVVRQESQDARGAIQLLPILVLKVRAESPGDAQVIANAWADVVIESSRKTYEEGVQALDTYIKEMYDKSDTNLKELETKLTEVTAQADLEVKETRREALTETIGDLEKEVLELETQIRVDEAAVENGRKRVTEQQYGGEWVGAAALGAFSGQGEPVDPETLAPPAKAIYEEARRYVEQAEALRDYRAREEFTSKEVQLEHYQEDLAWIYAQKAEIDDEIPALEAELGALEDQLASIPEKVVLDKAITDDALWNAHVDGEAAPGRVGTPLKTEEINPVYQSAKEIYVELTGRFEAQRSASEQLARSAERTVGLITALERELDAIQKEIDRRERELEATEGTLELLHEDYVEEMNNVAKLERTLLRSKEERDAMDQMLESSRIEAHDLTQEILQSEEEIRALTRVITKTENVQEALGSKAEEVALLQVAAQQASETGVGILYEAIANPEKVGPARAKIVLAVMVLAFLMVSLGIVAKKVVATGA